MKASLLGLKSEVAAADRGSIASSTKLPKSKGHAWYNLSVLNLIKQDTVTSLYLPQIKIYSVLQEQDGIQDQDQDMGTGMCSEGER